jgi:hypothetical protein
MKMIILAVHSINNVCSRHSLQHDSIVAGKPTPRTERVVYPWIRVASGKQVARLLTFTRRGLVLRFQRAWSLLMCQDWGLGCCLSSKRRKWIATTSTQTRALSIIRRSYKPNQPVCSVKNAPIIRPKAIMPAIRV